MYTSSNRDCYKSGDFDVIIISSHASPFCSNGARYVALREGTYSIKLINNSNTRADVGVTVDGQHVGTWRVDSYSSNIIERPANINRAFTFVNENSQIARQTGNKVGAESNGLISVTFKPETKSVFKPLSPRLVTPTSLSPRVSQASMLRSSERLSSGVTVLGRETDQEFHSTSPITNYDNSRITTIQIRLVVKDGQPDYISLGSVNSSKYPPRLTDRFLNSPY